MKCSWRRTLASVFLLLSPHSFLCQNAGPTGPLQPLPLLKETLRECTREKPIPVPQKNDFVPASNVIFSEFVPKRQYTAECKRTQENVKQVYPKTCTFIPKPIPGACSQSASLGVSQINTSNMPQNKNSQCITPQNPKMPTSPLRILSTQKNTASKAQPVTNLSPVQQSSIVLLPRGSIKPSSNFNTPSIPCAPLSQGLEPKITQVPVVPNKECKILPGPKIPLAPTVASSLNVPLAVDFQNVNTMTLPLAPNPYSQSYVQPTVNLPCKMTNDLTSLNFLPTPNIPVTIPLQSCTPISQIPVVYPQSISTVDCATNIPVVPDCQISALPPVLLANIPQSNNNFCRNPVSVVEDCIPVPINLQINVPPPHIPEQKIIIITANPPTAPAAPVPVNPPASLDCSEVTFELYPPYSFPPIIIEEKRSKSKNWLPLILIALFANDGCGCGGCCCPCNSDIPIPYPIPIPTNNPIITNSRKKTCKSS